MNLQGKRKPVLLCRLSRHPSPSYVLHPRTPAANKRCFSSNFHILFMITAEIFCTQRPTQKVQRPSGPTQKRQTCLVEQAACKEGGGDERKRHFDRKIRHEPHWQRVSSGSANANGLDYRLGRGQLEKKVTKKVAELNLRNLGLRLDLLLRPEGSGGFAQLGPLTEVLRSIRSTVTDCGVLSTKPTINRL